MPEGEKRKVLCLFLGDFNSKICEFLIWMTMIFHTNQFTLRTERSAIKNHTIQEAYSEPLFGKMGCFPNF